MAKDIYAKSKAFSLNALLKNTKISSSLREALEAPLGSTKRDKARSLMSSVGALSRNKFNQPDGMGGGEYDGRGGVGDSASPNTMDSLYQTSGSQTDPFSGITGNVNIVGGQAPSSPAGVMPLDQPTGYNFLSGFPKASSTATKPFSGITELPKLDPKTGMLNMPTRDQKSDLLNITGQKTPGGLPSDYSILGQAPGIDSTSVLGIGQKPGAPKAPVGGVYIKNPYTLAPGVSQDDIEGIIPKVAQAFVKEGDTTGQKYQRYMLTSRGVLDLLQPDPLSLAYTMTDDELKVYMSEAQRKLAEESGWTIDGMQTDIDGPGGKYLFIPSDEDINKAAKLGVKWVYDAETAGGWSMVDDPTSTVGQDSAAAEDAIDSLVETMNQYSIMDLPGQEGLATWWSNVDEMMPDGDLKNSLYEIYQLAATVPSSEALLYKVMRDRKVLSYILGIPESEVPVGISLAQQKQDIIDAKKQEYKIDESLQNLYRQINAGAKMETALPNYIREKDSYLASIDKVKKAAEDKMRYMDMANPYIQTRMQNYMDYLNVSSGRVNQRYSQFLNDAATEQTNNITIAQKDLEFRASQAEQAITAATAITEESYNEYKDAIKGWTDTLLSLNDDWHEVQKWNIDQDLTNSQIIKNGLSSDASKSVTRTDLEAIYKTMGESDIYSLGDLGQMYGAVGYGYQDMAQAFASGAKQKMASAGEGNYSSMAEKFINGLKSDIEKENMTGDDAAVIMREIATGVKSAIETAIVGNPQKIEALRDAINDLAKLNLEELDSEKERGKFVEDFSKQINSKMLEDIYNSYSLYKRGIGAGQDPEYPEDDDSFARQIADDVAGLYSSVNIYQ